MKLRPAIAFAVFAVFSAGIVMSSCTTPSSSRTEADITGVYTLVAVNGMPLPADITHEGVALQVRSGTFRINADGTCGTKTAFVPRSGTEIVREVSATYTRRGTRLSMQWQGAGRTVGTIEGRTFTMDNEGVVFAYQK